MATIWSEIVDLPFALIDLERADEVLVNAMNKVFAVVGGIMFLVGLRFTG
jgi:hypothetical protein